MTPEQAALARAVVGAAGADMLLEDARRNCQLPLNDDAGGPILLFGLNRAELIVAQYVASGWPRDALPVQLAGWYSNLLHCCPPALYTDVCLRAFRCLGDLLDPVSALESLRSVQVFLRHLRWVAPPVLRLGL